MTQPAEKTPKPSYLEPGLKKAQARGKVAHAVRRGLLVREPCIEQVDDGRGTTHRCNAVPTDAHHDDYDEPLGVRWLCRTHHRRAHPNVKAVAVRPGGIISLRRFRNDPQVLGEPVKVMRQRGGHREFVGMWYPAWAVEDSDG